MKRQIEPHKGGRDKWLSARVTEAEKDRLQVVLQAQQVSLSDYIMAHVERDEMESKSKTPLK